MILLIDNYDSFTFQTLFQATGGGRAGRERGGCELPETGETTSCRWHDALAMRPEAVVLSPGPCTPNEAGISLDLIAAAADKCR